jgi:hypothetical protein
LNQLHGRLQIRDIRYWRDKQGHEVDFVLADRRGPPTAIECKWSASHFDAANLRAFRQLYPQGRNLLFAQDVDRPYELKDRQVTVDVFPLSELRNATASFGSWARAAK